ncbi:MAG: PLDc N-terminal domain-containing protein [Bacillota bacterium]
MEEFVELLPILIPFIIINLGIIIYCVFDIHKADREVVGLSKFWWTIIVILVSFGWVIYLLAGRKQ